jgi:hypothetical protein
VINIYFDQSLGEQVCTCCRQCEGLRYVPGAVIFAKCAVGSGSDTLLSINTKVHPRKAKPNRIVRYGARLRNMDKVSALGSIAFSLRLPASVTFMKSRASSNYVVKGSPGASKTRYGTAKLEATVDTTPGEAVITWSNLTFPPRKSIKVTATVRVNGNAQPGASLVFSGWAYQQLPADGLPYCNSAYTNQTVSVVA